MDICTDFGLAELFEKVAHGVVTRAAAALEQENDWNGCSIVLVEAATAHARSFIISEFSQVLLPTLSQRNSEKFSQISSS